MSPAEIDRAEASLKVTFHRLMIQHLFRWVEDCKRAGLSEDEIAERLKAEEPEVMAAFKARLGEIRPMIVRNSLGIGIATNDEAAAPGQQGGPGHV
jgi:branched-subunit amino acid aminotransferase/4-amino-4-deoxychorismate lyase